MKRTPCRCMITLFLLIVISLFYGCASNNGPSSDNSSSDTDTIESTNGSVDIFINHIDAQCDNSLISAYISVIDEEDNLINNLDVSNFQISANSATIDSSNITFSTTEEILPAPVSVVIIMDYSNSITEAPEIQQSMETAVLSFIDLMGANDQAEIIKFNTGIRLIQPFTNDKEVLREAVNNMDGVEEGVTYLFDTLYYGIEDAAAQGGRMAVVAITDGMNSTEWDYAGDGRTMEDVINIAVSEDVPLFLVGLGDDINISQLTQMADDTSGRFYEAITSDELNDIYTSISELLVEGQYIIQYTADSQADGTLSITVNYDDMTDSASSAYSFADCL
ncbi:MAG: VWA domain-containing protein [Desulfobacteraceae bacterium]